LALLKLTFYGSDFQSEFFRVEWSGEKRLLNARLSPEKENGQVYADVISSSRPPIARIFFAAGTDIMKEHENAKRALNALDEPFQAEVITIGNSVAGSSTSHGGPKTVGLVFGATRSPDTIARIFHSYISWHALSWPFIFIIAEQEPPAWIEQVEPIVSRNWLARKPLLQESLLKNSHLVVITEFEYSIVLFSDKLDEVQITDAASATAIRHRLDLLVENNKTKVK
jgi:hypothetical protein